MIMNQNDNENVVKLLKYEVIYKSIKVICLTVILAILVVGAIVHGQI